MKTTEPRESAPAVFLFWNGNQELVEKAIGVGEKRVRD